MKATKTKTVFTCFLGGDDADEEYDLVFDGEVIDENFGWSLSGAEDINGDGITDIIVGTNGSENSIGKTYIFLGGQELDNNPDEIYEGELNGDNLHLLFPVVKM